MVQIVGGFCFHLSDDCDLDVVLELLAGSK